jgi:hypothetical protein
MVFGKVGQVFIMEWMGEDDIVSEKLHIDISIIWKIVTTKG